MTRERQPKLASQEPTDRELRKIEDGFQELRGLL